MGNRCEMFNADIFNVINKIVRTLQLYGLPTQASEIY